MTVGNETIQRMYSFITHSHLNYTKTMPRFIRPGADPHSALAAVRQYFGLSQQDMAGWLGVSAAQASHLETGRRALPPEAAEALAPLLRQVPAPGAPAAPALRLASVALAAPTLALAPPEVAPLEARLDYCQHHARRLRRLLRPLEAEATLAAHWAAAVPALRAALPPDPGPAHEPDATTNWLAWLTWHRHRWLAQRPTALPPDCSARYHLLRLQAEALDAEATALAALLGA
jgi:transcriptional regulator with XRE-family HTH domain